MRDYSYISVEIKNSIAFVMLRRPDAKNALNREMRIQIGNLFEELSLNDAAKGVILYGANNNFCCGGDVKEMSGVDCPYEAEALSLIEQKAFRKIECLNKPVVAAIEGFAIGAGFDLALSCDIRIAASGARLGFPEVKLGIVVGGGGIHKLCKNVGLAIAKEILFTGEVFSSDEALQYRLINKVVEGNVISYCEEFLQNIITNNSLSAIAEYKKLLHSEDVAYAALLRENEAIGRCFRHKDRVEGITSFVEKRKPIFE